jgi:N-methylhydantoinase A
MLNKSNTLTPLRLGVDSGGTFTDVCMFDETNGNLHVWKVMSTPEDPSLGIADAIEQSLKDASLALGRNAEIVYFGHGTTAATNALIVGGGTEVGMITTAGFRDIIELRRQKRDSLYDLQTQKPVILAARDKRLEVRERVLFDGETYIPLVEDDVRAAARRLREEGVRAVAVCFLFSYIKPQHEQMAKRIVAEEIPNAFLSVSHEVAPEFREYERFSTTVINAYLGPIMKGYLQRLKLRLEELGIDAQAHLTQSNGGVITIESAGDFPVRTILSGPASGVTASLAVGLLSGLHNIITFDMGGTSTDVSLIDNGRPQMSNDVVMHGYPLKVPMLDIHSVGAGGGSIAYADAGGLLRVGPQSAAADPGPVCYDRGNEEPTVTDANVVLQVLNPIHLLNGRLPINQAKAKRAIARLADKLGLDVINTAQGIISVVIANMAKAIRVISVERGYDSRNYTLLGFGGAGPIHAARLARALDIPRVVVPRYPGIMCALGLLLTDLRTNVSLTRMQPLSEEQAESLKQGFAELEQRIEAWFEQESIDSERRTVTRSLDVRYRGQSHELNIPCMAGRLDAAAVALLRMAFDQAHKQAYGYSIENEPAQVTTLRIEASGIVPKAKLKPKPQATTSIESSITGTRQVWLPETGGFSDCLIYGRERLGPGHCILGPAIVEQMDSTTLILPGQTATVDPYLNLIIEG